MLVETFTISDISANSGLANSMFCDRAHQFKHRQGWAVNVNPLGHELDEYDDADTTYVVAHDGTGNHLGSLRLRDLSKPCMLSQSFGALLISSPPIVGKTLEVTRFCLSPRDRTGGKAVSQALFRRAYQYAHEHSYAGWVGVFDGLMLRIYRANRWPLKILNTCDAYGDTLRLGYWEAAGFDALVPHDCELLSHAA